MIMKTDLQTKSQPQEINVALVGNPNCGKTTVFNLLTGLKQKIGNYPGVTVEKKTGQLTLDNGTSVNLHDLPGLYSMIPKSRDDGLTIDVLTGNSEYLSGLDLVIAVADAGNLPRNLYLITQVVELGMPVIVVLNMMDTVAAVGTEINIEKLSALLDAPVIPVIGRKGVGGDAIKKEIAKQISSQAKISQAALSTESQFAEAAGDLGRFIAKNYPVNSKTAQAEACRILSSEKALQAWLARPSNRGSAPQLAQVVADARANLDKQNISWEMHETASRYRWVDAICQAAVTHQKAENERNFSERLDLILTNRFAGPLIFLALFTTIFQSIFSWAELPMAAIESGVAWVGLQVTHFLPDGILQDLIVEGAIAGVGSILVFLPQIMFLFFFLSLLEDSGYMARTAFLLDRFMRAVGLNGRSVIPLLSSFACAIPGIMATRTILNSRDRITTIMIAPLMSCSARLPVYALMIGVFIPPVTIFGFFTLPGLVLLSMYLVGIVVAIGVALVLSRFNRDDREASTFIMELPPYRRPSLKWTSLQMWERAKIFITDAGKIIFAMSIVLWFLANFPKPDNEEVSASVAIKHSFAGRLGHAIEPAIEPLGFDWKMGVGLITSFAAREVMVSAMATIYNVEGADETSMSLREAMKNDRHPETGAPIYTPLTAISLMVFFVLACQCMSTVAVVKRETNSWRWPIAMIVYMTALAYVGSFLVFQGGKLLGFG